MELQHHLFLYLRLLAEKSRKVYRPESCFMRLTKVLSSFMSPLILKHKEYQSNYVLIYTYTANCNALLKAIFCLGIFQHRFFRGGTFFSCKEQVQVQLKTYKLERWNTIKNYYTWSKLKNKILRLIYILERNQIIIYLYLVIF